MKKTTLFIALVTFSIITACRTPNSQYLITNAYELAPCVPGNQDSAERSFGALVLTIEQQRGWILGEVNAGDPTDRRLTAKVCRRE